MFLPKMAIFVPLVHIAQQGQAFRHFAQLELISHHLEPVTHRHAFLALLVHIKICPGSPLAIDVRRVAPLLLDRKFALALDRIEFSNQLMVGVFASQVTNLLMQIWLFLPKTMDRLIANQSCTQDVLGLQHATPLAIVLTKILIALLIADRKVACLARQLELVNVITSLSCSKYAINNADLMLQPCPVDLMEIL